MAIGSRPKNKRNLNLFKKKQTMIFVDLAIMFNISEARAKQIYYKELGHFLKLIKVKNIEEIAKMYGMKVELVEKIYDKNRLKNAKNN